MKTNVVRAGPKGGQKGLSPKAPYKKSKTNDFKMVYINYKLQ